MASNNNNNHPVCHSATPPDSRPTRERQFAQKGVASSSATNTTASVGTPPRQRRKLGGDIHSTSVRNIVPQASRLGLNVPHELILHVVSFLNAFDVCSLRSCSKTLNEICNSDSVWKELYMKRWPDHYSQIMCTKPEGMKILSPWKATYISKHKEIYTAIYNHLIHVEEQLIESNSLGIRIYNATIDGLRYLKVGFEDVCSVLFRRKLHVLENLIGLHYSFLFLQVSVENLRNALSCYQLLDRELTVYWALTTPSGYMFFWPMEDYFLTLSLAEIIDGEEAILYFLQSGHSTDVQYITMASYFLPKE
ncbi:hypothetical protein LUZ60_001834 [Juncus effusus]|nr:hypothetical protein LUZ60_001834 [Juncus effusus]